MLARDGMPYHTKRHVAFLAEKFFHYSYVLPFQVLDKTAYYASWGAGVIPNYFERVYWRWVNGDLRQKAHVEREFNGVHEWLPERRGDCFTTAFEGHHPEPIVVRMKELQTRFDAELEILGKPGNTNR